MTKEEVGGEGWGVEHVAGLPFQRLMSLALAKFHGTVIHLKVSASDLVCQILATSLHVLSVHERPMVL